MAGDDRESESACDGFLDGFVAAEGQANLGFNIKDGRILNDEIISIYRSQIVGIAGLSRESKALEI